MWPNHGNVKSAEVTNGANVGLDQAINVQSKQKSYLSAPQLAA